MAANSFLDPTKLEQVKQKYITTFNKVDTLETNLTALSETVDNLDENYLSLSGGTVTGAVLSTYEVELENIEDNAFVTKDQVTEMIPSVTGYMPTSGGQFTGDVTTTNTTFTNSSLVTKNYVDTTFIDKAIFDVQTLPVGEPIKNVLYRTTVESPDSGTIAFEVKSEYESADEFINFFTDIGFTYQKIAIGSGTMADACIPPENAEYTIVVDNQNYTIDYIVYGGGSISLYTDKAGSEEKKIVVNISAGNYNISYTGTNTTYHYYLGNTNDQSTNELVLSTDTSNFITKAGANIVFNNLTDNFTITGTYGTSSNSISLDGNNIILSNTTNIDGENEKTTQVLFNSEGLRSDVFIIEENLYRRLFIDKNEMSFSGNRFEVGNGSYEFVIGRVSDEDTEQTSQFYLYKNSVPYGFVIDTYTNDSKDYLRITGTTINDNVTSNSPIYINGKILSTQSTVADFTNDNEFVTKLYVDNHTPDLSDYVTKTEYNELLNAYNDLAERLNQFLINTGEVPAETTWPPEYDEEGTTRKTIINTVDTNEVNIQCTFYGADNVNDINTTIDWGDGTVENIKDLIDSETDPYDTHTITHTYDSSKEYVITVEDISETVVFSLGEGIDSLTNNNIKDLAVYHSRAPLIKNNTSIEKYATLIPYCPDNNDEYNEKWEQLTQIDFIDSKTSKSDPTMNNTSICCGSLWHSGWFKDCSNLRIVNIGSTVRYIQTLFDNCPNIEEIHIKATIPPELMDSTYGLFVNGIPTNYTIYVPTESVDIYKNDTGSSQYETFGWSNYADHIVGE